MSQHREPENAKVTLPPRLESLVGLDLSIARVTGGMTVFGFGPVRVTARGGTVGTFALHVQCAWRIANHASILTGDADVWEYIGINDRPDDWEPSFGLSLQTMRMDNLLGARLGASKAFYYDSGVSVVASMSEPTTGDITIDLSSGHRLSVFPNGSRGEQWRFFSTEGEASSHLVFEFPD